MFDKLTKSKEVNTRWVVRRELKAEDQKIGHLLTFVTIEAYENRGGKVTAVDLFEGKHVVSDTELVGTMAREKLQAECGQLTAAGWGWAAVRADMPNGWTWQWKKIEPKIEHTADEQVEIARLKAITESDDDDIAWEAQDKATEAIERIEVAARARAFGAKQMAKSGCVVSISDAGELEVAHGVIKPDTAKVSTATESDDYADKRKERTKEKKKTGGDATVSNALIHRLSVQLTNAAAEAIKKHSDVALDFAIAALLANGADWQAGIKISHSGLGSHKAKGTFKSHYDVVRKLTMPKKLDLLASTVGLAFDFQSHNAIAFKQFQGLSICDPLGKEMVESARKAFDAEDYFKSVPKALCLAAITEAINADESRKVASKPKADIAKFAIANVPKTGWLPRELRTAHYAGPGKKK